MRFLISNVAYNRAAAYALRQAVFVEERGIPADVEFDQKDDDERLYVVAYETPDLPLATLRLEPADDGRVMRFGRVCTRKSRRGQGLGKQLLLKAEAWAQNHGYTEGLIHGEITAQAFYEHCGYVVFGGPYDEDGAPVVVMRKTF
ncbi:GNAT family N-acetyltransferase [Lactiplantibacillus mudanjiangensis]|uniref:GNAT family N-acetyltransferase [Lactobacillus pentosus] n=1 Tax=Lactiplantibacillus mudanjiangensis TaxID=1296538 RepID=A0A660DX83_9LACO|nr:GNAT family N-acetyltransferase [Lactiplantibacillus mudanjiangensis]VDG19459.1 GNAT family N-acetyltransferase [Lactobacillus pentosus] [Lactiplantibacillus mudanjiangensis]VDG25157.1 GNAT family N-acetyltransferase [Lactobacillus pentosus] [Lactiplantibacillus mudanjiangensis]VDG27959.1 GNAT family N-acetyltransferase [Lactobacillus pentosus] [Lactiplantibacillus mudanjiangensis]VDG30911.1 GNAT family N-acetyltransferase [Lactobacillus pentosus] [Lactiplantibacillus mudanjiangensis]